MLFEGQAVLTGIGLLLIGLVLFFATWGLYRAVSRMLPDKPAQVPSSRPDAPAQQHAMLIVQAGGWVDYMNPIARQWFDLRQEEQPNLESMARQVRPAEEFLHLCAAEGQARLLLAGRPVDVLSFRIPGENTAFLVTLRKPEMPSALAAESRDFSGPTLKILTDFSQVVAIDLGLFATIQAILENIQRLVPMDMLEINVWIQSERLLQPYRLEIDAGTGQKVVKGKAVAPLGYAAYLIEKRQALFIRDTQSFSELPYENQTEPKIRSYMGLPLLASGILVGTLEVGLASAEAYSEEDMSILQLIVGQAAVAIRNAAMLEEEQRRTAELGGLANLAQAISSSREPGELFARLVQSVAPLFDVEIVGFLTHNEERRALEGQVPFIGMPAQFVEIYRVPLQLDGPAEQIFLKKETLVTQDALTDETWGALGMHDFASAASIRDSALAPLISAGRILGYLQLANHRQAGASFSSDELRLLSIVANQCAAIIDNVTLVQQARQRVQRAESLRKIASLASSSATLDEVLHFAVHELSRLLQADAAAIFLLDEPRGILQLHSGSLFGVDSQTAEPLSSLYVNDPQFHFTVTVSQRPFLSDHLSQDKRVLPLYRPLVEGLKMESAVVVPLVVRDHGIGELLIASRKIGFFNTYDLQMVTTAASQLASAVEGSSLISQTDESLRQRIDHLTALTRTSREFNTIFELNHLLQVIYDESLRTAHADCGTLLVFKETGAQAGSEPEIGFHVGDQPGEALAPVERDALQHNALVNIPDFSQSDYQPAHQAIHSALVVPIAFQDKVIGLIHLHAADVSNFDPVAVEVIQTLAVQAAIALNNFWRFQELIQRNELLQRRSDALSGLFAAAHALSLEQPLEQSLELLAHGIQQVTPFQMVLMSVVDAETGMQQRLAGVGIPMDTLNMLKARQQPWSGLQQLLRPEFKVGKGYFIPYDQSPVVSSDIQLVTLLTETTSQSPMAWNPEDTLLFPLYDAGGQPIGLISLDAPRDGLRPDRVTLETIEFFAAQTALIIQGSRRLVGYKTKAETLETSLHRQQQMLSVSQSHLPVLLHKDLEQTVSIRNLEQRASRIRAGLEITETINRQVDAQSALLALGREMLTRLGMSISIVAENSTEGPRLLHILGSVPRAASPDALFGQRNPLRHSLQTGETLLVMNVEEDDAWRDTPLLNSLRAKGFICLPILLEDKPVAGILVISQEPMDVLTAEDRQVYYQIARQVSIILQNISLLSETRRRLREVNLLLDFSRQLGGLDPDNIVKALLGSALRVVTTAHAGAVLLWDERETCLVPKQAINYANNTSLMEITYHAGEALPGRAFEGRRPIRVDEVNFARDYKLPADNLVRYREATGGRLPVSSLVVPIQTGDKVLGVLVLDNFNTAAAFSAEDQALLVSLTQQVALSMENVRLVQASQERAAQLQALTNASATMTASLQSSELIAGLLDQLHGVLPYDTAILWLRSGNQMSVAAARGFPDSEQRIGLTVAAEDSRLLEEMINTTQGINVGDVRADPRFPALADAERLSWLGIPLISKGKVIGVLALEKQEANFYNFEHVQLVTTFASQAAVALENAYLYEESLRRAAELDQRSQRLALLNRLSSDLSGALNEEQVLRLTSEVLHRELTASKVSVVAFDRFANPVLQLQLPERASAKSKVLPRAPIFDRLRESLGVFSTADVAGEPDLQPLASMLKGTRSLLVLPLASGGKLRALIMLHMKKEYRFSLTELELTRTICNQAAIALESARLYQATVSRAEQLATINKASYEIGRSLDPEEIYVAIHRAVAQLMPAESFVISLLDEAQGDIEGVYLMDPGGRAPSQRLPRGQGLSGRVIETGESLLLSEVDQVESLGGKTYGEGQPRSIVAVPIMMAGKVIGMLSAQSYQPNVYTEDDQQILSTLANQAAVAILNGRLYAETRRLAEELEKRVVERTAELEREKRSTETLLRILTEVSASLDLDRALNRTLVLLNEAIGAEQGAVLLLNPEDNTIHYRAGYGYVTPVMTAGSKPTRFKSGEGLAGWVIKNRQTVLINDVRKDKRWVKLPVSAPQHRSVVAAPLVVGEDVIGVIMVFHREIGYFTPEHLNLVQAIGNQVAVAINNAQLYELIRDQAERLGGMLRSQQIEASRQKAILEAVADGVLVTDSNNEINFLNISAERILNLKSDLIVGQSLENFVGLFGRAAQTWRQTIHNWSEDPASYQPGDTYAEQLTLENSRVVLVHLAPVIWRNEFLGTVSIFRDITHEVEVDRLKSEFVATVSHELRTPMTSIKGYVDILLMGAAGALNENQTHFLEIVRSNTDRLSTLVNDLLDISRIEAGRVTLTLQPVNLREVADETIADVTRRSQEEGKPMQLTLDAPDDLPQVHGDLERVRQILDNLVDNAYRYTPENGKILVHLQATDSEVQVDVQDNGIGIPAGEQERIFERFYRGENPMVLAVPGTGLGLPIVKQLVDMHKGRIWMKSNGVEGQGSTFSFTLPIYQAKE